MTPAYCCNAPRRLLIRIRMRGKPRSCLARSRIRHLPAGASRFLRLQSVPTPTFSTSSLDPTPMSYALPPSQPLNSSDSQGENICIHFESSLVTLTKIKSSPYELG